MVSKKYRGTAPRPDDWDQRGKALLKSFGGSVEKRDESIRQTLEGLKAINHYEKRTGPGRKSSAEHAIAFYEYILGSDDEQKDELDEEDFLNQHNDECDVCEKGGELLCCSSCTLVFHLKCVRPKLEALPDGDWECPHCVMGSAKKSTRAWKEAAEAVKQMEKVKDNSGDEIEDEQTEDHEQVDAESNEGHKDDDKSEQDETSEGAGRIEDSVEPKSTKKALYKISDSLSPILKVDPISPTGRGKRSRRQPLLYQPQTVPASKWMSDEPHVQEIKLAGKDDNSGGEKGSMSGTRDRRRSREPGDDSATLEENPKKRVATIGKPKDEGGTDEADDDGKEIACYFCQDDPKIPICVFCGCRSCYGKHNDDKLLVCDQCESEYHIFCLKPALSSIPVRKWFCPPCKAAPTAEAKVSTRRLSTSPNTPTTSTRSSTIEREKTSPPKSPAPTSPRSDVSAPKRPRGRPPKIKSPISSTAATTTPPSPLKRPRGRPPKNATPVSSPVEEPVKRPRGRPPKSKSPTGTAGIASSQPVRKKPGPKVGSKNKRTLSVSSEEASKKIRIEIPASPPEGDLTESVKISRSGRVVKRSSFHDEMEEKEQHLRTTRRDEGDENLPVYEGLSRGYTDDDTLERDEDDSDEVARPIRTKVIQPPNSIQAEVVPPTVDPPLLVPTEVNKPVLPDPVGVPEVSPPKVPPEAVNLSQDTVVMAVSPKPVVVPEVPTKPPLEAIPPTPVIPVVASVAPIEQSQPVVPVGRASLAPQTGIGPSAATSSSGSNILQLKKNIETATTRNGGDDPPEKLMVDVNELVKKAIANVPVDDADDKSVPQGNGPVKVPRRKPGARECMQISRRFGNRVIPKKYMDILMDYCTRGKVEHLIRMRERLDEHALYLESQLAGLETLVREKGETTVIVPPLPERTPLDPLLVGGGGTTPSTAATRSYSPVSTAPTTSSSTAPPTSPLLDGGTTTTPATTTATTTPATTTTTRGAPPPLPRIFSTTQQQSAVSSPSLTSRPTVMSTPQPTLSSSVSLVVVPRLSASITTTTTTTSTTPAAPRPVGSVAVVVVPTPPPSLTPAGSSKPTGATT